MADAGLIHRCGCRDAEGKQIGTMCPKLSDAKHGRWGYYLAAGTDGGGKRVQIRTMKGADGRPFANMRAAQTGRRIAAADLERGTWQPPARERFADYLTGWIDRREQTGEGLRASTVAMYRRYIVLDIAPSSLGRLRLSEITPAHVEGFIADLLAAGRGATTVRRIVAVVRSSLASAVKRHFIAHNPAIGLDLPRVAERVERWWSPAQVGAFLDTAAPHRLGAMFEVAMFTGLRRGELVALRWEDVDLTRATLTVRRNRVQTPTGVVENAPKTAKGRRTIDLADRAVGALLTWQLEQGAEADEWGDAWQRTGYVFTREDGTPLLPQYASRLFDSIRERAGLPHLTFHGQRHTAASLMIEAGVNLVVVSRFLGHADTRITGDTYAHLIGDASRRAVESASALVPARTTHTPPAAHAATGTAHTLHTHEAISGKQKAPASAN